ncbi:MAG TPA: hypothetical protein VFE37_15755 [Chloroflexota bacterium]|nr:hypothetical protein [Chloroflexota bacterium]
MEGPRVPAPIAPSMRKVLDEIAASKRERDAAAAKLQRAHAASSAADQSLGAAHDDAMIACLQRQTEQLQALLQETAQQTRLLGEILARLPTDSPPVPANGVRRESS